MFFFYSIDPKPISSLSFAGMGLVLLPVCDIYQPALPPAGVLLALQEEEDAGKVGPASLQMHTLAMLCSRLRLVLSQQAALMSSGSMKNFIMQHVHRSNHNIISFRYGDMRVMMGCEIFSMWQNLGKLCHSKRLKRKKSVFQIKIIK